MGTFYAQTLSSVSLPVPRNQAKSQQRLSERPAPSDMAWPDPPALQKPHPEQPTEAAAKRVMPA